MSVDTVLYNAKLYIDRNIVEAGIAIDDGKIVKIAKNTNLPKASRRMNLNGHVTLPGLIDSHVHLRDQELAYKEDFITGTTAAAAGGVTSVIDMPNNKPVTMSVLSIKKRMKIAKKKVLVNVGFNSAFPKRLEEIDEIAKTGVIGFKVYMSNSIGGIDIDNNQQLSVAFQKVANIGVPVFVHAEDRKIIAEKKLEMGGRLDIDAYVNSHPEEAEVLAIKRIIDLVKQSCVHVHFCHISSKMGLNLISQAKKNGLPITCEITPHHLLLSSEVYSKFGMLALTDPPLRNRKVISALWKGLKKGVIDIIASDHAPHSFDEKQKSVWEAKPGIPGLETLFSLLMNQVINGRIALSELIRLTSENPAKVLGLKNRGVIVEGNWADVIVVDMKSEYSIDASSFHSKAKYSPFDGLKVKGKVIKTFVNGNLVMNNGEIFSK